MLLHDFADDRQPEAETAIPGRARAGRLAEPLQRVGSVDLRKVGNFMLAEWQRKAGEEGKKVIDQFRSM